MNITYNIRTYLNNNIVDIESNLTIQQLVKYINKYNNRDYTHIVYTLVNGIFASKDEV